MKVSILANNNDYRNAIKGINLIQGVRFAFEPASLYAYVLGANLLQSIGVKVKRRRPHSLLS